MSRSLLSLVVALLALSSTSANADSSPTQSARTPALSGATVDYESGVLAILRNSGRYGAAGTKFGVKDTNQRDNLFVASRLSVELERGRHTAVLLYAPLDVTTRATLRRDLQFRDELFASGTVVDHRYLFDGYRASYLYRVVDSRVRLHLGGSLQIRNARVAFTSVDGMRYAAESDIGIVPALKVRLRYTTPRGIYALVDADGLSTFGLVGDTEGGIYDVGLTLGFPVAKAASVFVRARALGGGATVPQRELENWAHFLSFTAGLRLDATLL